MREEPNEVIWINAGSEFADFFNAELSRPGAPKLSALGDPPRISQAYLRALKAKGGSSRRYPSEQTLTRLLQGLGWTPEPAHGHLHAVKQGRMVCFRRDPQRDGRTTRHQVTPPADSNTGPKLLSPSIGTHQASVLGEGLDDLQRALDNISIALYKEHLGTGSLRYADASWTVALRRSHTRPYLKLRRQGWSQAIVIPRGGGAPAGKVVWGPRSEVWDRHINDFGWAILLQWVAADRERDGLAGLPPVLHAWIRSQGKQVSPMPLPPRVEYQSLAEAILHPLIQALPADLTQQVQ